MGTQVVEPRGLAHALATRPWAQVAEILAPFAVAGVTIFGLRPFAGDDPMAHQGVVLVANILMLTLVWLGLKARGTGWQGLGLTLEFQGARVVGRTVLLSVGVFLAAVLAFIAGAIVMANLVGIPEGADTSGLNFLSGNLPLLLVSLVGVFIVSSWGEEIVYRGFLIRRVETLVGAGKWGTRTAVAVSSVVFGAAHFAWGISGVVQTTFMGLALAVAYVALGRKLWVVVLAHAYMDAILLVQMYLS